MMTAKTTGFVPVCPLSALADGTAKSVDVAGEDVCVARVGDEVFALRDVCSHAEVPLSEGVVESDGTISCWLHGSRFDLRTGEPDEPPAWEPVDTYQTRITDVDGVATVEVSRHTTQETRS
ncbi:MAG: non-heme iron oxygenase ferredoxin subunit [Candidatus Nanopelagicales bacterium]